MRVLPILCLSAFLAWSQDGQAQGFSTRQIADESKVNRDAVIGADGMVVWVQYITNDTSSAITELVRYQNGERTSLTGSYAPTFFGNDKPSIQGNQMVWIANYRKFEGTSFVLAEVPQKEGDPEEIPAMYVALEGFSDQTFANLSDVNNGVLIYTNRGVVITNIVSGGTSTNQARRGPAGAVEINFWPGTGDVIRVSTDTRHDFAPSVWNGLVAWQKEKGWPFGWEIMMWETNHTWQITTNYYYDMAPVVQGRQMVWYGWDGYDFEIFLYDADQNQITQITSNRYDDVGPVIWDGTIAWEGFPAVEADIFMWKNGQTVKLSDNVEDDFNPHIWNGQVVWQSFDGDDFEIYLYDGSKTVKLTANNFDDVNPVIRDGVITWMGYEGNWDAEIYAWDGKQTVRLTENEIEDRDPKTADGRIVWTADDNGRSQVWLAEPQ